MSSLKGYGFSWAFLILLIDCCFALQSDRLCEPHKIYKRGCNVCICNDDGKTERCSRKDCDDDHRPLGVIKYADTFSCIPGEKFEVDCNTCVCNENGRSVSCTEKACIDACTELNQVLDCRHFDADCDSFGKNPGQLYGACIVGCYCKYGFVRNNDAACIAYDDCFYEKFPSVMMIKT